MTARCLVCVTTFSLTSAPYHQLLTPAIPTLTGLMLSGAYKIPAIQINITGCFTNKMATDAYRGRRPAGSNLRPSNVRSIWLRLDLGRGSRRSASQKTFRSQVSFPSTPPPVSDYDSGDYEAALNKAQQSRRLHGAA
jgi:carbon-monoxide dehydrogenase large subunit